MPWRRNGPEIKELGHDKVDTLRTTLVLGPLWSHFQSPIWQDPKSSSSLHGTQDIPEASAFLQMSSLGSSPVGCCKPLQKHVKLLSGSANL